MTREQQLQEEVSFLIDLLDDEGLKKFKAYLDQQEQPTMRSEKELAELLEKELNRYGFDYKKFNERIPLMHRTIQQQLTRLSLNIINTMASQHYYDARNQAAFTISQHIIKYLRDTNQTINLPLI